MKKIHSLILLFLLIFSLVACSMPKDDGTTDKNDNMVEEGIDNARDAVDDAIDRVTPTGMQSEEQFTVDDTMPCVSEYSQYSDKLCGFGFKKSNKGVIPSIGIYEDYLKGNDALYVGNTDTKTIYLTFDEGYENGYTGKILDTLKEKNVPAAFFCTGDYIKRNKELVKRMIDEGHIVGNHTWNHKTMPSVASDTEFKEELTKFDDYMLENFKIRTGYFRYPNGEFSEKTLKIVKDMGYKTVFWSLAYKDWEKDVVKGADYAVKEVVDHIHNGAIILLHAVSSDNAEALPLIIERLNEEGYTFANLDNLKF